MKAHARRLVAAIVCLVLGVLSGTRPALAQGVSVEEATAEQKQAAQAKFDEAMGAFKAKRLDEALAGFRASYAIVASPNSRLMVANVLQDQGKVVAAYREAEATVAIAEAAEAHDDRYAAAAESARKGLARMRAGVALVTVTVTDPTGGEPPASEGGGTLVLTVAGERIDPSSWGKPVAVEPGQCEVVLTSGDRSTRKEIAVSAGGAIEITMAAPAADAPPDEGGREGSTPGSTTTRVEDEGGDGTAFYAAAGVFGAVGIAGAIVFAVMGSNAQSNYDDLVDRCPDDRCSVDLQDQADTTRTQQTVANIAVVAGAVGLAASVAFLVAGVVVDGSSDDGAGGVGVSVGPGSVAIVGRF